MTLGPGVSRTLLPSGFAASGINSGLRRYRPDLGVLFSAKPCLLVNRISGKYAMNGDVRALVSGGTSLEAVESSSIIGGITSEENIANGREISFCAAMELTVLPRQVVSVPRLTNQVNQEKVLSTIPQLFAQAGTAAEGFALSILNQDLLPKVAASSFVLGGLSSRIVGICQGTENSLKSEIYLMTDVAIEPGFAKTALQSTLIEVFGAQSASSVDAHFMANGAAGDIGRSEENKVKFLNQLREVVSFLAVLMNNEPSEFGYEKRMNFIEQTA